VSNLLVVKDKVSRYARELFSIVQLDDDGDLIIPYESTKVWIQFVEREVSPDREAFWNENQLSRTVVQIWAPLIIDVKPSAELYKWVATEAVRHTSMATAKSLITEIQEMFRFFLRSVYQATRLIQASSSKH